MNKIGFIIGACASKLYNYPSMTFLSFLAVLLTALDYYLLKSFKPVLKSLPDFFVEWAQQSTFDGFLLGFVLFAYVVIIFCSLMLLKNISKKLRNKFKEK